MIVIAGNFKKPGTKAYSQAVEIIAKLGISITDAIIVNHTEKQFYQFGELSQMNKKVKIIAVGEPSFKKLKNYNANLFLIKDIKSDIKSCRKWLN